jgi:hypothetical protein
MWEMGLVPIHPWSSFDAQQRSDTFHGSDQNPLAFSAIGVDEGNTPLEAEGARTRQSAKPGRRDSKQVRVIEMLRHADVGGFPAAPETVQVQRSFWWDGIVASRTFSSGLILEHCLAEPSQNKGEGLRVVCIRETLRDLKESAKLLIEDELQEFDDLQDSRYLTNSH